MQLTQHTRRPLRSMHRMAWALIVCTVWCIGLALCSDVHAQTAPVAAKDPSIIITRTVNPRIAYRGIPKEDMPIAAEATTFPQASFEKQMNRVTTVGDETLGLTAAGTEGVNTILQSTLVSPTSALTQALGPQGSGGGTVPRGMGASIGGAVGGATSNIGNTVNGALNSALGKIGGSP